MLEIWWPFLLLIVVAIGGGWVMMRAIGTGREGTYLGLMQRQAEAMEAHVALQAEILAEMRRQTALMAAASKPEQAP